MVARSVARRFYPMVVNGCVIHGLSTGSRNAMILTAF